MENSKNVYRITIEAIGDEGEEKFCGGGPYVVECEGFAVFAKQYVNEEKDGMNVTLNRISSKIIAQTLFQDEDLKNIGEAYVKLKILDTLMTAAGRKNA